MILCTRSSWPGRRGFSGTGRKTPSFSARKPGSALSSTHGRKPDLTTHLGGRRPSSRGVVDVPPDIAVEVTSPSPRDQRRDHQDKMLEYATFGIPYWIVDLQQRRLESACARRADERENDQEAAGANATGRSAPA